MVIKRIYSGHSMKVLIVKLSVLQVENHSDQRKVSTAELRAQQYTKNQRLPAGYVIVGGPDAATLHVPEECTDSYMREQPNHSMVFQSSSMTVSPWVGMAARLEGEESSDCSWYLFLSLIMLACEYEDNSNMMEVPKFQ